MLLRTLLDDLVRELWNASTHSDFPATSSAVKEKDRNHAAKATAFLTKEDLKAIRCTQKSIPNSVLAKLERGRDYEEVFTPIDPQAPKAAAEKVDAAMQRLFDKGLADPLGKKHGPVVMLKQWLAEPKKWPNEIQNKKRGIGLLFRKSALAQIASMGDAEGGGMQLTKKARESNFGPATRTYYNLQTAGETNLPGLPAEDDDTDCVCDDLEQWSCKQKLAEVFGLGNRPAPCALQIKQGKPCPTKAGCKLVDENGQMGCVQDCEKFSSQQECDHASDEVSPPVKVCKWYDTKGGHCGPDNEKYDAKIQAELAAKKAAQKAQEGEDEKTADEEKASGDSEEGDGEKTADANDEDKAEEAKEAEIKKEEDKADKEGSGEEDTTSMVAEDDKENGGDEKAAEDAEKEKEADAEAKEDAADEAAESGSNAEGAEGGDEGEEGKEESKKEE
ncbi:unnamed protein product [Amoebophrya sp. A120]|nr:unnamed protein product [Amoebophrya sp. A120]|eukprot:GSA120T00018565001.1